MGHALWRNNRDVDNAKQFIELLRELRQENDPPVRVRLVFNGALHNNDGLHRK